MAKLIYYYGSMASSKTLRLLSTAYNFEEKGVQIMVLKPSLDTRDGNNIIHSRAGLERECVMVDKDVNLYNVVNKYASVLSSQLEQLKWVIIDECQFLTERQVDELSDVVDYLGINVMCYGLRTDFRSRLFQGSKRLFEIADTIEEIKSTCECGNRKTSINARFDSDGNIITDGNQVVIGGDETYTALCRKCWKNKIKEKLSKENEATNQEKGF